VVFRSSFEEDCFEFEEASFEENREAPVLTEVEAAEMSEKQLKDNAGTIKKRMVRLYIILPPDNLF
jgi:hypothetical protein